MAERGRIYGPDHRPIDPPASTHPLPTDVQAFIKAEVNTAMDGVRQRVDDQLRDNKRDANIKSWIRYGVLAAANMIFAFIVWIVSGPEKVQQWTHDFVKERMNVPMLQGAAQEVMSNTVVPYVQHQLALIETTFATTVVSQMETQSAMLRKNLSGLETSMRQLGDEAEKIRSNMDYVTNRITLLEMFGKAYGGDAAEFELLKRTAAITNNISALAAGLVETVQDRLDDLTRSTSISFYGRPDGSLYRPEGEHVYAGLIERDRNEELMAIDEAMTRSMTPFVETIGNLALHHSNLLVRARAYRAFAKLLGMNWNLGYHPEDIVNFTKSDAATNDDYKYDVIAYENWTNARPHVVDDGRISLRLISRIPQTNEAYSFNIKLRGLSRWAAGDTNAIEDLARYESCSYDNFMVYQTHLIALASYSNMAPTLNLIRDGLKVDSARITALCKGERFTYLTNDPWFASNIWQKTVR